MENNDQQKVKISIRVGNRTLPLKVNFDRQEFVRDVEDDLTLYYRKWRHDFPAKHEEDLLAMLAYHYASLYFEMQSRYQADLSAATECDTKINEALEGEL